MIMIQDTLTAEETKGNISENERLISALTGAALLITGLLDKKKQPLRILTGGLLMARAASGYCPARAAISHSKLANPQNVTIETSVSVNKPRAEVYAFWRNIENLPAFMKHLHSVKATSDTTSIWKANIPGGFGTIEWNATIVFDEVNTRIGWKSDEDAAIENAGTVLFTGSSENETEIHVIISYHAPAGIIGEGIARLLNPAFEGMILEDIKSFKRYIETGETPAIER
jgi:uncharacterized membrane protein